MIETIRKYPISFIIWCMIAILIQAGTVRASDFTEAPYRGYHYNVRNESVPSPSGFLPEASYTGEQLGAGKLNNPQDLFVDQQKQVYILDSGNNRIVVLNENLQVQHIIDQIWKDGQVERLNNPGGLFVGAGGKIYVADTDNRRVLIIDRKGQLLQEIGKPDSELIQANVDFKPSKVLVDRSGTVYVLSRGIYQGALTFDEKGQFIGFFGSERIEPSLSMLQDYFWKKLLNRTQRLKMARYVPVEYTNFDMDHKNFVYTVTSSTESVSNQIKRLNPSGLNTMPAGSFGDLETVWEGGKNLATVFVDIFVDDEGFISALDQQRGRIFQYDMDGNLLFIEGGLGSQTGTFKTPSAIAGMNGMLLIADAAKNNITVYKQTSYGHSVRGAVKKYVDGQYAEAVELWREVLGRNGNLELAYTGIGKALYNTEQYKEAMAYFELGYNMAGYSDAYKAFRKQMLRKNALPILLLVLALLAVATWTNRRRKQRIAGGSSAREPGKLAYPFYIMLHPAQGFEEMGWSKKGSLAVSAALVSAWFLAAVAEQQWSGFIFNPSGSGQLNVLLIFARTAGLFVLWVIANWSLCTLMDGKGRAKEIWIYSSYALLPLITVMVLTTIASNFLTVEEAMFLEYASFIAYAWSIVLLLIAMSTIHEYSLKKTLASSLLSVGGIAFILFLGVLLFGVLQQIYAFADTIYKELLFRL
ncbi:YIP1 family protein [Paenibacillus sp. GCM10027626]|uniref:YIP1 family protein n=1 Tax=Paenibacillus sp. GCM10027626 TaxID=3273411 RepID=UPI00363EE565